MGIRKRRIYESYHLPASLCLHLNKRTTVLKGLAISRWTQWHGSSCTLRQGLWSTLWWIQAAAHLNITHEKKVRCQYMLILLRTIQKIQLIPTSRNPRFLYRNERQSYRTQSLPTNPSSYHRGRRNQRKGESLNKRRVRSTLAKSSSRKFITIRTNNQQPCTSIFNSLEASKHMSPCLPVGPPFIKSQQHFPGLR